MGRVWLSPDSLPLSTVVSSSLKWVAAGTVPPFPCWLSQPAVWPAQWEPRWYLLHDCMNVCGAGPSVSGTCWGSSVSPGLEPEHDRAFRGGRRQSDVGAGRGVRQPLSQSPLPGRRPGNCHWSRLLPRLMDAFRHGESCLETRRSTVLGLIFSPFLNTWQ